VPAGFLRLPSGKHTSILTYYQTEINKKMKKFIAEIAEFTWVNGFEEQHFTSTRRFFHHHLSKWVNANFFLLNRYIRGTIITCVC